MENVREEGERERRRREIPSVGKYPEYIALGHLAPHAFLHP
jgi:hypothetical protein